MLRPASRDVGARQESGNGQKVLWFAERDWFCLASKVSSVFIHHAPENPKRQGQFDKIWKGAEKKLGRFPDPAPGLSRFDLFSIFGVKSGKERHFAIDDFHDRVVQ